MGLYIVVMADGDGPAGSGRLGSQLARMETEQSAMNLEVFAERMGAAPGAEPAYGIVINARGGF